MCDTSQCATRLNVRHVSMYDMSQCATCLNVRHASMCDMSQCATCLNVATCLSNSFDTKLRFDTGLRFWMSVASRPVFLSNGVTAACFISAGTVADSNDIF